MGERESRRARCSLCVKLIETCSSLCLSHCECSRNRDSNRQDRDELLHDFRTFVSSEDNSCAGRFVGAVVKEVCDIITDYRFAPRFDSRRLLRGQTGGSEALACLQRNAASLSPDRQTAVSKAPTARRSSNVPGLRISKP
jgi:hypothetical protein